MRRIQLGIQQLLSYWLCLHSVHCGIKPLKNTSPPLNLQNVQIPPF